MTAVIHTAVEVETQEVDGLSQTSALIQIEEFLRDPIGYGDYNFADPISLEEFSGSRHMHSPYIAVLS